MTGAAVAELLGLLTARGIELQAEGGRLRFRPKAAMTSDLAERVKRHKPELLALLAGGPEPLADEQPETHADREWRRFLAAARPWPDGRGWYDPQELERFRRLTERPAALPQGEQPAALEESAVERAARYRAEVQERKMGLDKPPVRLHNVSVEGDRCT